MKTSIYEIILKNTENGCLPGGFVLPGSAAGGTARDTAPSAPLTEEQAGLIRNIVDQALYYNYDAAEELAVRAGKEIDLLSAAGEVTKIISAQKQGRMDRPLYVFARTLAKDSAEPGAVKLSLLILGLFGVTDSADRDVVLTLGQCEELAPFSPLAAGRPEKAAGAPLPRIQRPEDDTPVLPEPEADEVLPALPEEREPSGSADEPETDLSRGPAADPLKQAPAAEKDNPSALDRLPAADPVSSAAPEEFRESGSPEASPGIPEPRTDSGTPALNSPVPQTEPEEAAEPEADDLLIREARKNAFREAYEHGAAKRGRNLTDQKHALHVMANWRNAVIRLLLMKHTERKFINEETYLKAAGAERSSSPHDSFRQIVVRAEYDEKTEQRSYHQISLNLDTESCCTIIRFLASYFDWPMETVLKEIRDCCDSAVILFESKKKDHTGLILPMVLYGFIAFLLNSFFWFVVLTALSVYGTLYFSEIRFKKAIEEMNPQIVPDKFCDYLSVPRI